MKGEGFKGRLNSAFRAIGKENMSDEQKEDLDVIRKGVNDEDAAAWKDIETTQSKKEALMNNWDTWRHWLYTEGDKREKGRLQAERALKSFERGKRVRDLTMRGDAFQMVLDGGGTRTLSEGDVYAAQEWGFWWRLDDSVPPKVARKLMTHQVRGKIAEHYDTQLILYGQHDNRSHENTRGAYKRTEEAQEQNKNMENFQNGVLAEKVLLSYLTKEMHDNKEWPFEVTDVDVLEDVEHKIDFIVTVKGKANRFVQVAKPTERIGIQFTLNRDAREYKLEQARKSMRRPDHGEVDQLVVVALPIDGLRDAFNKWRYDENDKKRGADLDPRGPDHFLTPEMKKAILDALVREIGLEDVTEARKAA